jgi:transposase
VIVTGFEPDCREVFREFFPKAVVVIDIFHTTALSDDVVEAVRKAVRAELKSPRTKAKLKDAKIVLKMDGTRLPDWARQQLQSWRDEFPLIGIVFDQKEAFCSIYQASTREDAKVRLDAWKQSIPVQRMPFWNSALETIHSWEQEILNFFDLSKELQDAYWDCQTMLEDKSNWLETQSSRGHSFEALRIKLLLEKKQA